MEMVEFNERLKDSDKEKKEEAHLSQERLKRREKCLGALRRNVPP